jgi:hypothetical protein
MRVQVFNICAFWGRLRTQTITAIILKNETKWKLRVLVVMWRNKLSYASGENGKWYSPSEKQPGSSPKRYTQSYHYLVIPFLSIHPREMEINVHTRT